MKLNSIVSEEKFKNQIDKWVENKIKNEINDFESLILSLPSIYPQLVLESLDRLYSSKKINNKLYHKLSQDAKKKNKVINKSEIQNIIFPPHPLDFDWRFTQKTTRDLIKTCIILSKPDDTIVFLGTPSLFGIVSKKQYNRRFILIDTNPSHYKNMNQNCSVFNHNLFKAIPSDLYSITKLVIMDPPWYPDYQRAFLNNTSKICKLGGTILMVASRVGTRPNIHREWQALLKWIKKIGLSYEGLCNMNIAYDTPYFEKNALKAIGITNFPYGWRRADLAIFRKKNENNFLLPKKGYQADWYEESYMGLRIRRHPKNHTFKDPSLLSVISGDILPSVSRRDPHRNTVDVWSFGNRVFNCKGTNILHDILCALKDGYSPNIKIESSLGRKLEKKENQLILKTIRQVNKIINIEKSELFGGKI